MAKNIEDLTPGIFTHPGEALLDELKARKIKQKDFADIIGILPSLINEVINGKRRISPKMACLIGAGLNMDPEIWLNVQRNYDLDKLEKDKAFQKKLKDVQTRKWIIK